MHSKGLPMTAERAGTVAENDSIMKLLNHEEVALDPALEIDQYRRVLVAREPADTERIAIGVVDVVADTLTDHTDESGGLVDANRVLQRTGEFAQQRAREQKTCALRLTASFSSMSAHCCLSIFGILMTLNRSRSILGLVAIMLLGVIRSAHANVYCIDTTANTNISFCTPLANDCSLRGVISLANSNPNESVEDIRIPAGTYDVSGGLEFDPPDSRDNHDFTITGGWNSTCTARTINAAATVLNANNQLPGDFFFKGNHSRLVIEGLSFRNFTNVQVLDALCPVFNFCADTDAIRVRWNEFRNGKSVQIIADDARILSVTNNLFSNLTGGSFANVHIKYSNDETTPVIAFNTFANLQCMSTSNDAVLIDSEANAAINHNIIESSGCGDDLFLAGLAHTLRNNLYFNLGGVPPAWQTGTVFASNPGFVNAAAGDFHLLETAPASTAINAGLSPLQAAQFSVSFPSQDLDGPVNQRVLGLRADIGAYESSINDSSTLIVTSAADGGAGTLRQAMISANATAGAQKIEFNIAGACPRTLSLLSPLPDVIGDLEIDGYSQTGAAANTLTLGSDAQLCIIVAGTPASTLTHYLSVLSSAPGATSLAVKGLAFASSVGFSGSAIQAIHLQGGQDHVIQGNAFGGTGPSSIGALGIFDYGVRIDSNAQKAMIGGPEPEHRNSFGGMRLDGIFLFNSTSSGHTIQNNYIGLTANGATAAPIGMNGIRGYVSSDVRILDNVIAATPEGSAIIIDGASGYLVRGNQLGVSAFGISAAQFRIETGIRVTAGSGNHEIGSVSGVSSSNLITNAKFAGVWISSSAGNGTLIRPNRIYGNGIDGIGLGIDLGLLGPLANDPGDTDGGPNRSQNTPVITASVANPDGTRQVFVTLNSTAIRNYRVDIYRSPNCAGGNRGGDMFNLIGSVTTASNILGLAGFNVAISGANAPGYLTSVATNLTTQDTSEVSACFLETNSPPLSEQLFKDGFE